jgi:hypothetical protein
MTYTEPANMPWTFDEVHAAIEHRFADTPYAVTRTGDKVTIQADLADTTYLTWAWAHHVNEIRGVEVKARKNGKATTRDYSRSIAVSAGKATLTGAIKYSSGRQWSLEKNIEYGVGLDGSIGRQVDYTYSTREIQTPVNDVLRRSGWYAGPLGSLPADAKIGAVVAIATIVGLVVAGLAVLAVSLA